MQAIMNQLSTFLSDFNVFQIRRSPVLIVVALSMFAATNHNLLSAQEASELADKRQLLAHHFDAAKVFDEVVEIVAANFFSANFDSDGWQTTAQSFRKRALSAKSHDDFDAIVNEMVATLKTSHTYYYSRQNPKHFQLVGIFEFLGEGKDASFFQYEGIGINTIEVDRQTYVSAVYEGLPAADAGIQFGDQIQSINDRPFHKMQSFAGKTGKAVSIRVKRAGKELLIKVEPEILDGRTMFETSLSSSIKVIESNGKKIGYVHALSYAGTKYQELIRSALLWGKLSTCDGLILDLRDGWGGADLNYLNLFRSPIAKVESTSRGELPKSYSGVWEKAGCPVDQWWQHQW